MRVRPVGDVGVAMRVQVGDLKRTAFVELQLGHQRVTLTQDAACAVMAGIEQMLTVARKFDAEEHTRHGAPEPRAFSSAFNLRFEVVHDVRDRDELLAAIAARIEGVMRGEGVECRGWGGGVEPAPGDPDLEPEHNSS